MAQPLSCANHVESYESYDSNCVSAKMQDMSLRVIGLIAIDLINADMNAHECLSYAYHVCFQLTTAFRLSTGFP